MAATGRGEGGEEGAGTDPKVITARQARLERLTVPLGQSTAEGAVSGLGRLRAVFDAIQAPHPPTDPVGGRLSKFYDAWSSITRDGWVLQIIRDGYKLEFSEPPPAKGSRRPTPLPADPTQAALLRKELQSLITKEAVVGVKELPADFFMATFFLAPKKGGKWRPIINLKPLNRFIKPTHFRMETIRYILPLLRRGEWATSIDLSDAYLHIPIHPEHRKFLMFELEGKFYKFQALPFGLSTAPRVFTRVARVVGAHLRRMGINIFMYLDDWLIVAGSESLAARDTQRVLDVTQSLGWIVNREKSDLTPSQRPVFLGTILDFRTTRARPTNERVQAVQAGGKLLLSRSSSTAHAWLVFLGYLASLVDIVPWCRFHMRDLQIHLLKHFVPSSQNLSVRVPLTESVRPHIQWWCDPAHLSTGVKFNPGPPSLTISTDASLMGWGAHSGSLQVAGTWSGPWLKRHINILELEAVRRALLHFQNLALSQRVLVRTDNTTVVAYINRQGGTHSIPLWTLTKTLLLWCQQRDITLKAVHLPGKLNTIADLLSRLSTSPTEWSLHPEVTRKIWQAFGTPDVDLFASIHNFKLPIFCALTPHDRVWRVDSLSFAWNGFVGYAFPPVTLVPQVLEKCVNDAVPYLILVAPLWPSQVWFPQLLGLLTDVPRVLPVRADLLRMPLSGKLHPGVDNLRLTVWPLSANPCARRVFRKRLRTWRPVSEGTLPWLCIREESEYLATGAPRERFLRPLRL